MTTIYTTKQVEQHSERSDLWMIIEGKVYNISAFLEDHPGGEEVLLELGGKDGTDAFDEIGHSPDARELLKKFYIGDLDPKERPEKVVPESRKVKSYPGSKRFFALI